MPRLITTPRWGCNFKCGYVSPKRAKIEKHEQTCFHDPARRACKTCKHDRITHYSGGEEPDKWCEADARPEGANAIVDCPAWEPSTRTLCRHPHLKQSKP